MPGGTKANLAWVAPHVRFPEGLPPPISQVLADAQTNGGLLAAVAPEARATSWPAPGGRGGGRAGGIRGGAGARPGIDVS